jgi:hypothetical protein
MRVAIKGIQGYARVSRDASYLMRGAIIDHPRQSALIGDHQDENEVHHQG